MTRCRRLIDSGTVMTLQTSPINPRNIPRDPYERAQWVLGQLKLRGTSCRKLSLAAGYNANYVAQGLYVALQPAEALIATALGTTEAVLFPERHDENGNRLRRRNPRHKSSHSVAARNDQTRGAA